MTDKKALFSDSFLGYSVSLQVRLANAVSAKRIPREVYISRLKKNSFFSYMTYIYLLKACMAPFFSTGGWVASVTSGSYCSISFCSNCGMSSLGMFEWCITI